MKKTFLAIALTLSVAGAGCSSGLGSVFFPKPVSPVAPTTAGHSWAMAKAAYHSALTLFIRYAEATCPANTEGVHVCDETVDPREVEAISRAQVVHVEALAVISAGDEVHDGNYAPFVAELNRLVVELTKDL